MFLQRFTVEEHNQFNEVKAQAECRGAYQAELDELDAAIRRPSYKATDFYPASGKPTAAERSTAAAAARTANANRIAARDVAQKRLKELSETIRRETRALLKERFDYPIFMYEAEKVGITATGEADRNELYPNDNLPPDLEATCLDLYRQFRRDPERFFRDRPRGVSAAGGAFAVGFGELERWDPASFHGITWHWPASVMTPIGSMLRLRREKADRTLYDFASLQPITIHFDGSIDRREVEAGREYTMDLQFARPGDVVVAKIDLKNGAVGLVPDWKNVVVTNHFAVYEPDRLRLVPEYFTLLIQTGFFKAYLWRNKVGAEGRKEVKLEFFESIAIPLPSLETQRAIVVRWQAAQAEADAAEERVKQVETETDFRCYATLELEAPKQGHKSRAFVAYWRGFSRWSVSFNQAAETGNLTRGKYPIVALGSILDMVQYGTSDKANSHGEGVPVLRISNIKSRTLDLTDLKYVPLPTSAKKSLLLQDGDILIIRTSGSRDLVGTCAVFHESTDFVFASYLIRLRVAGDKADADYLSWLINSAFGRQQVDAISRQIMQNNINSEELRSLQIPLPPLDIQRAIVERVQAGRAEIARLRADAERVRRAAGGAAHAFGMGVKPDDRVPWLKQFERSEKTGLAAENPPHLAFPIFL